MIQHVDQRSWKLTYYNGAVGLLDGAVLHGNDLETALQASLKHFFVFLKRPFLFIFWPARYSISQVHGGELPHMLKGHEKWRIIYSGVALLHMFVLHGNPLDTASLKPHFYIILKNICHHMFKKVLILITYIFWRTFHKPAAWRGVQPRGQKVMKID